MSTGHAVAGDTAHKPRRGKRPPAATGDRFIRAPIWATDSASGEIVEQTRLATFSFASPYFANKVNKVVKNWTCGSQRVVGSSCSRP